MLTIHAALARFLASRGVDCQHVLDLKLGEASDAEIWAHASRNDYVVISKDEDFLYLANVPHGSPETPRKSPSCGLGFYNLETEHRGLLLEVFELLTPGAFLVIFHPFIDVLLTVLQH